MGDDLTRDHYRLMPRDDRGRAYRDRAHPSAHPRLDNVDMPPAGVVADAKSVFNGDPSRRSRLAFGLLRQLGADADFGQRLFDNLLEGEARHAVSPKVPASPPDTRWAASAIVSSAKCA